jgi:pyruvate formate lyase activating enzyme
VRIAGVQGLSLIDYPGKVAAVVFLAGCDFRCPFCQNPDLTRPSAKLPSLDANEVVATLTERRKLIDGVVLTGGEPLLSEETLALAARLREALDLPLKLDTHGHHPELLREMIEQGQVQYVAMDVKSAPSRYSDAAGGLVDIGRIRESIELLKNGGVDYEFRTTAVPGLVDEAAVDEIGRLLQGARLWAFQQYQNRVVLDPAFVERRPYPPEHVRSLAMRAEQYVKQVALRGL